MDFKRSIALSRIKPSATIAITQKARDLRAAGRDDIISLSIGEPDFDTPEHVKEAALSAMRRGETKYPPVPGIVPLREAIAEKFARDNGLKVSPQDVIVCNGGKQVIANALIATLDPGDEVIVPAPYWVSYPELTSYCGATPVIIETSLASGFKLTPDVLEAAITPRTRWLVLNSPSNPSGAVYSSTELRALANVLMRHPRVLVMSDDIYEHLIYNGEPFATIAGLEPALSERTLTLNGVSKAYAMTGWRIGFATGAAPLIKAMSLVQSQMTGGACSIAQWAALAALTGPQDERIARKAAFAERRDRVMAMLEGTPGLAGATPDGAFYMFPSCQGVIGRRTPADSLITSDEDFVAALLDEASVAVVHGAAFGLGGYFRLSYAASMEQLVEACGRIRDFCERLT